MRLLTLLGSLSLLPFATGQDLGRGLVDADVVVVARQVGKKPFGDDLVLHRVQVLHDVRGAGADTAVTVLDWPKLGLHLRPSPRQSRLYCLQDASVTAAKLGLPANDGPYYRMVGWPGSNPLIGSDLDRDANLAFARVLAASEAGAPPATTAAALCTMALDGEPGIRQEAVRFLLGREDLRAQLGPVSWSRLMTRACGEVDDVPYKIALAELCAEQRLDGLLDALAVSLGPVQDPEFARAVGRIGRLLHGEQATNRLEARLQNLGDAHDRAATLLAIGATNTKAALAALQRMDQGDKAVEAALREHRAWRAAQDAVGRRK
ncbi:MAG: hypothetical protein JNN13_10655 [Planctomycetes bacterium]|nr:hypothetical protein [Planctomycetota bacterium]